MPRLVSASTLASSLRTTSTRSISTSASRASSVAVRQLVANKAAATTPANKAAFSTTAKTMAVHAGIGKGEDNVRPPPDQ